MEPERKPYLVRVDGNLAGFVLVARYNHLTGLNDCWIIAEFFVMRKYRHQGIGDYVARFIFDQFSGNWQVGHIKENLPATDFWHEVIGRYLNQRYQEYFLDNHHWHGPVQAFASPPKV